MTNLVEYLDETNVRRHRQQPDALFNESESCHVLLRPVTLDELRAEWRAFNARLRTALLRLFLMPMHVVVEKYGLLNMNTRLLEMRKELEFGFVSQNKRFNSVRSHAVVRALVELGVVGAKTMRGASRQQLPIRKGGIAAYVEGLGPATRKQLLQIMLHSQQPLDEILDLHEAGFVGDQEISRFLSSTNDIQTALVRIAARTQDFFGEQPTTGRENNARGRGRTFGWAWFSQHLTSVGIWLNPPGYIGDIVNLFPRKFQPVAAWLAISDEHVEFAERVLDVAKISQATSAANIFSVFLTIAQSSNAFLGPQMRAGPFEFFKEWTLAQSSPQLRSSSASHLFRLVCSYHSIDVATHPIAHNILGLKRLVSKGVDAFAWCDRPNHRNTRLAQRCLGRTVETVPWFVRDWADTLRGILPLFGTRSVKGQFSDLQVWLIFLLSLEDDEAPKSFRDVVRGIHVNDGDVSSATFVNFAAKHFSEGARGTGYRVASTLAKAWQLAATRDGFTDLTNPFDAGLDRVAPAPKRHAKSTRRALDQVVRAIVLRENRRDDFAFARQHEGQSNLCWYKLRNQETGRHEFVFFPLVPILINVILNSGMRRSSARWLDSGEGDEFAVDVETRKEIPNPLTSAIKLRREGFIKLFEFIDGDGRRRELGMYLNTSKTSAPYGVPWIEPALVLEIERLRNLQTTFNPMNAPILAKELGLDRQYGTTKNVPTVFPLFRDPKYPLHFPVSDDKISRYWFKLLQHCEPLVAKELGYTYPLVNGEGALFDIHALRVTMVTVLIENDVPVEVAQALVGHSTVVMTLYYNQVRETKIHRELQRAFVRLNAEFIQTEDAELVDQIAREAVQAVPVDDPEGLARLRRHVADKTAPIDYFAHGICPGGDCSTGGKKIAEGKYLPVFRQRACSRCRFRVTGPMFLHGLVHRLNGLMFEISESMETERQLNCEADQAEDNGNSAKRLRSLARNERERRDALLDEWCAEYKAVRACEASLKSKEAGEQTYSLRPAIPDFDVKKIEAVFCQGHRFQLAHGLVTEARFMPEALVDQPSGVEAWRDNTLLKILRQNGLERLMYRMEESVSRQILDDLGDRLVAATSNSEELQSLIDGEMRLGDIAGLRDIPKLLSSKKTRPTLSRKEG